MARPPDIKRIRKEDFDPEDHPIVEKLAYSLNTFMDQVIFILTKNVDFQNLNQVVVDYTISTDASGNLVNPPNIRTSELRSKPIGIICISAQNQTDPTIYPTSQPFVSFTLLNNETIDVLNITGLQNSSQYVLKLLIIG